MAAFHYVQKNLLLLSLASPPLSQHVFFSLRLHWLYLLMRSDFIKESLSQPSPGLFNANASISSSGGGRLELLGKAKKKG